MKEHCAVQSGVVMRIEGGRAVVGVERGEACGACAARNVCGTHGHSLHEVVVALPREAVGVGDRVTLSISQRERLRAVLLAYVVPFVLVLVGLVGLISNGVQEGVAGLVSMGLVALYYAVLYLFRGKWTSKVSIKDVQKES